MAVLRVITNNPSIGFNDIVSESGLSRGAVNDAINRLLDEGSITKFKKKGRSSYFPTRTVIIEPEVQGDIIFQLIHYYIELWLNRERKLIFLETKNMTTEQMLIKLRSLNKDIEEYRKNKDKITQYINDVNKYHDLEYMKDEIIRISNDEVDAIPLGEIDDFTPNEIRNLYHKLETFLNPMYGALMLPYRIYAYKIVIEFLIKRMIEAEYRERRSINHCIKILLELMIPPYDAVKIDDKSEQGLIDMVDMILKTKPEIRYEIFMNYIYNDDLKKYNVKTLLNIQKDIITILSRRE